MTDAVQTDTVSINSLDKLAKLLATENISVIHQNVQTAYFDLKTRTVILPMWKDMPRYLYHFLILHEVGHALYTDQDAWKNAIDSITSKYDDRAGEIFKSYLNVIEDARIERKMKLKFPGSLRDFSDGYIYLNNENFFDVKSRDFADLPFIDRINLFFKIGHLIKVPFTNAEQMIVTRVGRTMTFDDVIALSLEIFEASKTKNEEAEMSMTEFDKNEEESDDDSDFDDTAFGDDQDLENIDNDNESLGNSDDDMSDSGKITADESVTENAFEKNKDNLIDSKYSNIVHSHIYFEDIDHSMFTLSYKEVLKKINSYYSTPSTAMFEALAFQKFRNDNLTAVQYMVKEFEMRKAASEYSRIKQAKTGVINPTKLHSYSFNDDIFRKLSVVQEGKNHGIIMYVDFSGSMQDNFYGTIQQLGNLVLFCRRVNIPHRVFGFASMTENNLGDIKIRAIRNKCAEYREKFKDKNFIFPTDVALIELFNEHMSLSEFNKVMEFCLGFAAYASRAYDNIVPSTTIMSFDNLYSRYCGTFMTLQSTPFNSAMFLLRDIVKKFRAETKREIINFVSLTDGSSDHLKIHFHKPMPYSMFNPNHKTIIVDVNEKRNIAVKNITGFGCEPTIQIVQLFRDSLNINFVGFFIASSKRDVIQSYGNFKSIDSFAIREKIKKELTENNCVVGNKALGHDEFYFILGGKYLETKEFAIEENASKAKIKSSFIKSNSARKMSRHILNKFIGKIAA